MEIRTADRFNRNEIIGGGEQLLETPPVSISQSIRQWLNVPEDVKVSEVFEQASSAVVIAFGFGVVWVVLFGFLVERRKDPTLSTGEILWKIVSQVLNQALNAGNYLWVGFWVFILNRMSAAEQSPGTVRPADVERLTAQLRTASEELLRMNERLNAVQQEYNRLKEEVDQSQPAE